MVSSHYFPLNYGLCCAHSRAGSTLAYQRLCRHSKCKWTKRFIRTMKLRVFFSGQNKADVKASLVKLSTAIVGNVFRDTPEEELAGRRAEEERLREEGGCGVMWKGKAAAEKWGRMMIQAGEQLGKMREEVKRVRQSWKTSVHDIAAMWWFQWNYLHSRVFLGERVFVKLRNMSPTITCRHLTWHNKAAGEQEGRI